MSNEELIAENSKLREEIKQLKELLKRKSGSNSRAYEEIRAMIIAKVNKDVNIPEDLKEWQKKDDRGRAERQIMSDLKWDLHIRRIADFRDEHIEQAREYLKKYEIPEELKKSRWTE